MSAPTDKCDDVIVEENGKWYFWDEVWLTQYGPYQTEEECEEALDHYCRTELEGK